MFQVKLIDIAGDGLITEINSPMDTLIEVEIMVEGAINQHLAVHSAKLVHTEDLIYSVWLHGTEIGVVVIKDINPVPLKRE